MDTFIERNPETALTLLERMLFIRMVEEAIAMHYPQSQMRCPVHLCVGQEAVPAASGLVLRKDDLVVSTHRCHGHYLGKGGDLSRMLAEIYGKFNGCSGGKGGSMHLIDESVGFMGSTAIVGGTIPVGVGLSLGSHIKKSDQIACVFFGDGATEEGAFYESLNFAALKQLPVLFVCENNFYSVYSSLKVRQPSKRRIHKLATAIGVPGRLGNGNDVVQSYELLLEEVQAIRSNQGPRLIEFETYRRLEHCGPNPDDDLAYRDKDEVRQWKAKDPIRRMIHKLMEHALLDDSRVKNMKAALKLKIETAFAFAQESPFPEEEQVYCDVYSN